MLSFMRSARSDTAADHSPPGLASTLAEAGVSATASPTEQRAALEAMAAARPGSLQQLDACLLHLRELERADELLPAEIDGVRRIRLLSYDALTTSWIGWDLASGGRAAMRCLKPGWRQDPVALRRVATGVRLAAGTPGLAPMRWCPHGDWPHVRYDLPAPPLSEYLPVEDPPDLRALARWLVLALLPLHGLHQRGLVLGGLAPDQLLLGPERPSIAWLDPIGTTSAGGGAGEDLSDLARCLVALDPWGDHPLVELIRPWIRSPPASAPEAIDLVRRALADQLLAERHRLALRGRSTDRGARAAHLLRAANRLQLAMPPPAGRACLRAGHDSTLHLVQSDGRSLKGGAAAGVPPHGLLTLYGPGRGLDAQGARSLLRAWNQRQDGDEQRRAAIQERWGAAERQAEDLVRWLAAAAKLRRARLVLAIRLRGAQGRVANRRRQEREP